MKTAICPGSFDPVTLGHLDIIERAAGLFDQVTVLVMQNSAKQDGLFTVEERCRLIRRCLHAENIQIDTYDGLLVDYAKQTGAAAVSTNFSRRLLTKACVRNWKRCFSPPRGRICFYPPVW